MVRSPSQAAPIGRAGALPALLAVALLAFAACGGESDSADRAATNAGIEPTPTNPDNTILVREEPVRDRVSPPRTQPGGKSTSSSAADWECVKGYSFVAEETKEVCETTATVSVEDRPAPGAYSAAQVLVNDTFELAKRYAHTAINSNFGGDPFTYRYLIYPQDCAVVSGDTARCLVYLWKQTYATGYGAGGVDRGIWRETFLAVRVARRTYSTRIVMIDFVDPYRWDCSDTPRQNTARCT